jgi:hypothetical protein
VKQAWRGLARRGSARHGVARAPMEQYKSLRKRPGRAWLGTARRGRARVPMAHTNYEASGGAWRGKAGPGMAGQGSLWDILLREMNAMEYDFVLTGRSPILFHADDVLATDKLQEERKHPDNKKAAKGDDRFPAWTWQAYLYHNNEHLVIPSANIMACLRKAGARIPMAQGKGTFKALSQSQRNASPLRWKRRDQTTDLC